ncbi:MAG: biotin synthase, partial [Reinekea forsetii]|nr:biotin synthase [Reinekea forsetii]
MSASLAPEFRYDWTTAEVVKLFELPFNDLMFQAAT